MRSTRRSSDRRRRWSAARGARALAALIAAAPLIAAATASAAPAALELDAAWGGFARPGSATELRIRLSAAAGGLARLRIAAGRVVITTAVTLRPGVTTQVAIPVPAAASLDVDASLPGGSRLRRGLALRLTEDPLVALSPGASSGLPDDLARADTDANGYPRHAEAYEAVDAVAIDDTTLGRLDSEQLKALLTYIERCGPTLAVGLPGRAAALLRANAGCGGRALELLADPTVVGQAAGALLASAPPAPVSPASLRSLLPRASDAWPLVVAGLAIYAAGALLLVVFRVRTAALASYALAAALIAWIAGHLSIAAPRLAVWAESDPGDHWGRYAALAEFAGTGRALRSVAMPRLLGGAQPCGSGDSDSDNTGGDDSADAGSDDGPRALWRWDAQRGRFVAVTLHQRLFAAPSICWRGAFPLARSASLTRRPDRAASVTNLGEGAWPPGIAVLDDVSYTLPAVAPRATAALAPLPPGVVATPSVELAVLRADGGGALLWPLDLPPLGLGQAAIRAYLLEHVPAAGGAP